MDGGLADGGHDPVDDEDDLMDPDGDAGPEIRRAPSIAGDAIEGAALTASLGEYSGGAALEGVWQRCNEGACRTTASAEDGEDYVLTAEDVGYRMRLKVTATDDQGVTQAVSPLTDAVVGAGAVVNREPPVLGEAFVFRALEVTGGSWLSDRELTRTFRWQRCVERACEDIAGASGPSYTPELADLGARLKVVESVTADDETFSASSEETNEVTCAEPLATEPIQAGSASSATSGVKWTFTGSGFPATAAAIGPAKRSALFVSHGFGYALPEGQVQGVEVRITRRASAASAIRDRRVALYAPAARTQEPRREYWTERSVTSVYGGPTDTWGQSISTATVSSSQLRVAVEVENAGEDAADAVIEGAEVVVYYAAVTSTVFDAKTVTVAGAGSDWVNAPAAVNDNDATASVSIPAGTTPVSSKSLTFSGFGVTLASGAIPSGFALEVRQASTPGLLLSSAVKAGTSTEMKNQLPPTLDYVSYGGPGVSWGLTNEQVTAAGFSVQLQVMGQALASAGSVQVDAVRLRVYFGAEAADEQRAATVLETTANEVAWSNAARALSEDGAVASTSLLSEQRASGSLVLSGFTADLPEGAAISGVTLDVKRSATAAEQLRDTAIFLRQGAKSIGSNRASADFWPVTREAVSYGGPHDRWGAALEAADVGSGELGAELTVAHGGATAAAAPEVDALTLTIHYCTD